MNNTKIINQATQNRYQNAEKTKLEALTVINHYRSLSPKKDKFMFNDGTEKELLNLEGTIPVRYKGSTYNIPICVWLLDNHPFSAPMVYVTPTVDMLIKPSRHVDQNGKVYLPYLHEWNPQSYELMGLIQIMIMTFAEMPPVYSKPRNSSPAHFQTTPYPTQPTGYPMPGGGGGPPMPYPPMPPTSTGGPANQYSPYHNPAMPSNQPPYPVYPPAQQPPYPGAMPPTYPGGTPYPTYPPTSTSINAMNSGDTSSPSTTPMGVAGGTTDPNAATNTGTITEEHIRASLVSAVSHLVREKLRDAYGTAQAEVSVLRQQQVDLTKGKGKLEELIQKLSLEQTELDKSIRHMQEKELEMKSVLDKVSLETEPLDLDEAVTTTAPIYKQLLHAYAEDQATQDAIYYLGESLRRDVVDLDTYLKHVRALSRRQFQLRATVSKCRAKANLPG